MEPSGAIGCAVPSSAGASSAAVSPALPLSPPRRAAQISLGSRSATRSPTPPPHSGVDPHLSIVLPHDAKPAAKHDGKQQQTDEGAAALAAAAFAALSNSAPPARETDSKMTNAHEAEAVGVFSAAKREPEEEEEGEDDHAEEGSGTSRGGSRRSSGVDAAAADPVASSKSSGPVSLTLSGRPRNKRRRVEDISPHEIWRCSFAPCTKIYKRTSTISIHNHQTSCKFRPLRANMVAFAHTANNTQGQQHTQQHTGSNYDSAAQFLPAGLSASPMVVMAPQQQQLMQQHYAMMQMHQQQQQMQMQQQQFAAQQQQQQQLHHYYASAYPPSLPPSALLSGVPVPLALPTLPPTSLSLLTAQPIISCDAEAGAAYLPLTAHPMQQLPLHSMQPAEQQQQQQQEAIMAIMQQQQMQMQLVGTQQQQSTSGQQTAPLAPVLPPAAVAPLSAPPSTSSHSSAPSLTPLQLHLASTAAVTAQADLALMDSSEAAAAHAPSDRPQLDATHDKLQQALQLAKLNAALLQHVKHNQAASQHLALQQRAVDMQHADQQQQQRTSTYPAAYSANMRSAQISPMQHQLHQHHAQIAQQHAMQAQHQQLQAQLQQQQHLFAQQQSQMMVQEQQHAHLMQQHQHPQQVLSPPGSSPLDTPHPSHPHALRRGFGSGSGFSQLSSPLSAGGQAALLSPSLLSPTFAGALQTPPNLPSPDSFLVSPPGSAQAAQSAAVMPVSSSPPDLHTATPPGSGVGAARDLSTAPLSTHNSTPTAVSIGAHPSLSSRSMSFDLPSPGLPSASLLLNAPLSTESSTSSLSGMSAGVPASPVWGAWKVVKGGSIVCEPTSGGSGGGGQSTPNSATSVPLSNPSAGVSPTVAPSVLLSPKMQVRSQHTSPMIASAAPSTLWTQHMRRTQEALQANAQAQAGVKPSNCGSGGSSVGSAESPQLSGATQPFSAGDSAAVVSVPSASVYASALKLQHAALLPLHPAPSSASYRLPGYVPSAAASVAASASAVSCSLSHRHPIAGVSGATVGSVGSGPSGPIIPWPTSAITPPGSVGSGSVSSSHAPAGSGVSVGASSTATPPGALADSPMVLQSQSATASTPPISSYIAAPHMQITPNPA